MTTSATRQGLERTIAEREAWKAYRESLRDLEGADYEETERDLVGAPAGDAARAAAPARRPTERPIPSERRRPVGRHDRRDLD